MPAPRDPLPPLAEVLRATCAATGPNHVDRSFAHGTRAGLMIAANSAEPYDAELSRLRGEVERLEALLSQLSAPESQP